MVACLQSVGIVPHAPTLSASPRMSYFPQPSPHVHALTHPSSASLFISGQSVARLHFLRAVGTVCPDWIRTGPTAWHLCGLRVGGWRCCRRSLGSLDSGLGTLLALPASPLAPSGLELSSNVASFCDGLLLGERGSRWPSAAGGPEKPHQGEVAIFQIFAVYQQANNICSSYLEQTGSVDHMLSL